MRKTEKRFYKDCDLLKKGKNVVYVWKGIGWNLSKVYTNRSELSIEELAYICIKANLGDFIQVSQLCNEDINTYYNSDIYAYCDMSSYGLENGFLLIQELGSNDVEIHA